MTRLERAWRRVRRRPGKEPRRVVDEMEHMLKTGFAEIHVVDDSFTQELDRAKEVCREVLSRGHARQEGGT